jgi:hypothetical protein
MKLPHANEAAERCNKGTGSALDWFIYRQQPAGTAIVSFRQDLQAALDELENEHGWRQMALVMLRAQAETRSVWWAGALAMLFTFTLIMLVSVVLWGGC